MKRFSKIVKRRQSDKCFVGNKLSQVIISELYDEMIKQQDNGWLEKVINTDRNVIVSYIELIYMMPINERRII